MKYLKKFETHQEYAAALESDMIKRPNVSLVGRDTINFLPLLPPDTIIIDQTITDPAQMISGDINGAQLQNIRNSTHRYLAKNTESGVMTLCQLDDSNSALYADGTSAITSGAEGDVFVRLPRFAFKAEEMEANKWKISFIYGDAPDDSWQVWDNNELIGAYEASLNNNKLYSYSDVLSDGGKSQTTYSSYAIARGVGFSLVKWKHHCILAFLFYALYGTTLGSSILGKGKESQTNVAGGTNALGMTDTTSDNTGFVNFLGIENWFGARSCWLGNATASSTTLTITEDDGSERKISIASSTGYISKVAIGQQLDLAPTELGATSQTGYCSNLGGDGSGVLATHCFNAGAGNFAEVFLKSKTYTYRNIGTRIAFRGVLKIETDTSAFKALSAI